jgi:hypothetical protein
MTRGNKQWQNQNDVRRGGEREKMPKGGRHRKRTINTSRAVYKHQRQPLTCCPPPPPPWHTVHWEKRNTPAVSGGGGGEGESKQDKQASKCNLTIPRELYLLPEHTFLYILASCLSDCRAVAGRYSTIGMYNIRDYTFAYIRLCLSL